jgi:hypothetical protein
VRIYKHVVAITRVCGHPRSWIKSKLTFKSKINYIILVLWFWALCLDLFLYFFLFVRCFRWGYLACECAFEVRGCQIVFPIFFWCFAQRPSYLLHYFSPVNLSTPTCIFWCNPHIGFWEILGPKFLDCSQTPLVHRQAPLLISNGGIGLISTKVITLEAYLGSWALVASIIAIKFFLNYYLFLLEVIGLKILVHSPSKPI